MKQSSKKTARILSAAYKVREPFDFKSPAPFMYALSLFNLEKIVEMVIEEERCKYSQSTLQKAVTADGRNATKEELRRGADLHAALRRSR